jgi:hypothetical protein
VSNEAERLIRLATQIIRHLPPGETRATQTAEHIRRFWTPKMRQDLHAAVQGQDIDAELSAVLQQI